MIVVGFSSRLKILKLVKLIKISEHTYFGKFDVCNVMNAVVPLQRVARFEAKLKSFGVEKLPVVHVS